MRACARTRSRSPSVTCRARASCAAGWLRWPTTPRCGSASRRRSAWAVSSTAERRAALERILRRDARHRWSRVAVESALGADTAATLIDVLGDGDRFEEAEIVTGELADLVGAGVDRDGLGALSTILRLALSPSALPLRAATVAGLASGLARAPRPPAGGAAMGELLDRVMEEGPTSIARSAWLVRRALALDDGPAQARALAGAARRARDRSLPIEDRAGAVDLLALGASRCGGRRSDRTAGGGRAFRGRGSRHPRARRFRGRGAGPHPGRSFSRARPRRARRCDRCSTAPSVVSRRSGQRRSRPGSSPRESFTSTSSSGGACCGRTLPASRRARRR